MTWPAYDGVGAWNDDSCDSELCGFCDLDQVPTFTLRGKKHNHSRKKNNLDFRLLVCDLRPF